MYVFTEIIETGLTQVAQANREWADR